MFKTLVIIAISLLITRINPNSAQNIQSFDINSNKTTIISTNNSVFNSIKCDELAKLHKQFDKCLEQYENSTRRKSLINNLRVICDHVLNYQNCIANKVIDYSSKKLNLNLKLAIN